MLTLPPSVRVYVWREPIDIRSSFDRLAALVRENIKEDPLNGHLYVFLNRRLNALKVLLWDRSGYCIYYKRLEQGVFRLRSTSDGSLRAELSTREFFLFLEGLELKELKQRKRYYLQKYYFFPDQSAVVLNMQVVHI